VGASRQSADAASIYGIARIEDRPFTLPYICVSMPPSALRPPAPTWTGPPVSRVMREEVEDL
jgi:hypothetical protein